MATNEPQIVQANIFGESTKKLPYTVNIPASMYSPSDVVIVEAPCLSLRVYMIVRPAHTVVNIIESIVKYRKKLGKKKKKIIGPCNIALDIDSFGLTIRKKQQPIKLLPSSTIASNRFVPEQILWFHQQSLDLRICIMNPDHSRMTMQLQPDSHASVRELIGKIRGAKELPEDYGLYYTANGIEMMMELDRCLLFFRLVNGEELLYQKMTATSYSDTLGTIVKGTSDVMACVECPHLGIVKKMRLKKDVAFAEILSRFAEKNAIGELGDYEILIQGAEKACNPLFRLSDFVQGVTCNLEIRKATTAVPTMGDGKKRDQFGSYLGSGKDPDGYFIPQILIDFFTFLEKEGGFKEEGIFRLAGSSSLVDKMLLEISNPTQYRFGGNEHEWGLHEVATLIKKWFLMMPKRLFSSLSDVQMRMCAENTPERVYTLLDPNTADLLKWLVKVLAEVSIRPESKMDAFNLGLVFAPCIACEDNVSLAAEVTLTKYAGTVLEKCILQREQMIAGKKGTRRSKNTKKKKRAKLQSTNPTVSRSRGFITLQLPNQNIISGEEAEENRVNLETSDDILISPKTKDLSRCSSEGSLRNLST